ncbi:MAG: hypothetical protein LBH16_08985 [Treponema sp.]|jgi:predicted small secreted protein|nr:hypothetical protein [Treponema sp.]
MTYFLKGKKTFSAGVILVLSALFFFTACNTPFGFGEQVDFVPPILTLDPVTNPYYVRLGSTLTGTVTDVVNNIEGTGVDYVIMREAGNTEEIFRAVITGDRWEIFLDFTEEQNGEKIPVEILAYDRAGNSGDTSIAAVSLIIDIRPPFIQDIYIERTSMRTVLLEPIGDLRILETEDPRRERSANADRYQNGWFTICARVMEEETRINEINLAIYDTREPNTELMLLDMEAGSSTFSPRWLVKEDDILAAGERLWPGYTAGYYESNERYYYRVDIIANDRSENELVEDMGYFCLWQESDIPKGILDPIVGTIFTRGSTLPVEFFDDDSLDWAYADMFTLDQWNATSSGNPKDAWLNDNGLIMPFTSGDSDNDKLIWLKEQLDNGTTIYNWKFSKRHSIENIADSDLKVNIDELLGNTNPNEKVYYVPTGDRDNDYGEFVLFTLAGDSKLEPHSGQGPEDTNRNRWNKRAWRIEVIDENIPLIVFDTVDTRPGSGYEPGKHSGSSVNEPIPNARTGDSPEENTFPRLTDGRYFTINGYTLRENRTQTNEVEKFRMAWIPYGMGNGHPDSYITAVQNALSNYGSVPFPDGVKDWDLSDMLETGASDNSVGGIPYIKQAFRKEFDILGGTRAESIYLADYRENPRNPPLELENPAAKPGITEPHFIYNDKLENETKLFIFYAKDNMGHEVFRQLRLLSNKTPPDLGVYNMTGRVQPNENQMPPNIYNDEYMEGKDNIDDEVRAKYKTDLYAMQETGYNLMRTYALTGNPPALNPDLNRAEPLQAFPRDTTLMFWVTAERSGELAIQNIRMQDVTYASNDEPNIGHYDRNARSLSYYERLPEIGQRIFIFTAEDTLGNEARIQRTVAVTNAAVLSEISTTQQDGSYGIGEEIILRAYFSNLVYWRNINGSSNKPQLNIRYQKNGAYVVESLETETEAGQNTLFLEFKFPVREGYTGDLQTMYNDNSLNGDPVNGTNRPIKLPAGIEIVDSDRNDKALTPGNDPWEWTTKENSLQDKKTITLQGIRPVINDVLVIDGKTQHSDGAYYFKSGETIDFTLKASAPIFTYNTSGAGNPNPRIRFKIQGSDYYADYQRNISADTMLFSHTVSTIADGEINRNSIGIDTQQGAIGDSVGNYLASTVDSADTLLQDSNYPAAYIPVDTVRIDKLKPAAPVTLLGGEQVGSSSKAFFNATPVLTINNPPSGSEPWCDIRQYSLNGGFTWETFPVVHSGWTASAGANALYISNGQWNLWTRYIDRAGNEGAVTAKSIEVNAVFPRLIGITAVQPNATYTSAQPRLDFTFDFDDTVTIAAQSAVTITLADINRTANTPGTALTSPEVSYQRTLTAASSSGSTVTFTWTPLNSNTYDMLDGLKITSVNLSGLNDKFGNHGPSSVTLTWSNAAGGTVAYNGNAAINYNISGIKVSTISPQIRSRQPQNAQGRTGNITLYTADPDTVTVTDIASGSISKDNRTIRLTFSKPVQKGNGTITIRPHGNYAIPAVFENEGYYVGIKADGQIAVDTENFEYTYSSSAADPSDSARGVVAKTWVAGFSDIFNNVNANDKNTLIGSASMSDPALVATTGLSAGPYLKTTHGLKRGAGFTGNYNNSNPGVNAPGPEGTAYMVPDISTKWVLRYSIEDIFGANNTTASENTVVTNIRTVLNNAKFRWQEIAVTQSDIIVSENTVTIKLPEPLLPGLQWTLHYDAGTFADEAGTPAAAVARGTYWFWSGGVQKPVIRVERKSYDARTAVSSGAQANPTYNADGYAGTIVSFETVAYRIVSETPNSRIFYSTLLGSSSTGNNFTRGSALGAWTGDINTTALTGITSGTTIKWEGPKADAGNNVGAWVRPNLIFRNNTGTTAVTYTVMDAGVQTTRAVNNGYFGLRSYNKDATVTDLAFSDANLSSTTTTGRVTADIPFGTANALQASKNYIVANTRIDHRTVNANGTHDYNNTNPTYTSQRGYEGVYRTVLMMNQSIVTGATNPTTNYPPKVNGSTRQSGLPTIAGFPLKDNATGTDSRYMKVMYRVGTGNTDRQWYWVSTEIVSQIYIQIHGRGIGTDTSFGTQGDSRDWMTMGYGDLTYCLGWQ